MTNSTRKGSQHWLQVAVNDAPKVLLEALRPALQLGAEVEVDWCSPLAKDNFCEYRDMEALRKLGIESLPGCKLNEFWPPRGPVWDALGKTTDGQLIFVEAKAHIAEMNSPPSSATSAASIELIENSLQEARKHFALRSDKVWGAQFYQYVNRLAHHYLFRTLNELPSHMVFLYFLNASEMNGPKTQEEWTGAIELLHSVLGLTQTDRIGVHEVFVDVARLANQNLSLQSAA